MRELKEELALLVGAAKEMASYVGETMPEGTPDISWEEFSSSQDGVFQKKGKSNVRKESLVSEKAPPTSSQSEKTLPTFQLRSPSIEETKKVQEKPRVRAPVAKAGKRLIPARIEETPEKEILKRTALLQSLQTEAADCSKCKLFNTRKKVVFGEGPAPAPIMFIGEGPGAQEDRTGLPFVGAAGKLLQKIIEAMGFTREGVYISNVVKCRPPNNRNPESDEIFACEPYLIKQVEIVSPKVIVTLGKFALQSLLSRKVSIMALRGKLHEYCGIPLMPTFHPAYLLRNPESKRLVWEDMQEVRRLYEEIIASR